MSGGDSKASKGFKDYRGFLGILSKVLKIAIGVFIVTQTIVNSYASENVKLTDTQFKKLQSKLAYIDYAITANNAIALADKSKWYTNGKYRKSVINEIGFAIEKCLLGKNEHENGIVIFYKGMTPKNFTQANYNAWLLYNYVDTVITNNKDATLEEVADKIQKHYPKVDNSKMNKAIQDINEYLEIEVQRSTLKETIMFYHKHNEMKVNNLPT